MLKEGDQAIDFTLLDKSKKAVSLNDFKNKWVVLYFYPKDNTSGCTKEAMDFTEMKSKYEELGAVIIGISPDSPDSHIKFVERHGLDIILLSDENKDVLRQYGAWGKKKNYGREYEGVIRSTFLISPEGKIVKIWRNVKVRKKKKDREERHAEVVYETLKEMI